MSYSTNGQSGSAPRIYGTPPRQALSFRRRELRINFAVQTCNHMSYEFEPSRGKSRITEKSPTISRGHSMNSNVSKVYGLITLFSSHSEPDPSV